jgi:hypothetical protein
MAMRHRFFGGAAVNDSGKRSAVATNATTPTIRTHLPMTASLLPLATSFRRLFRRG